MKKANSVTEARRKKLQNKTVGRITVAHWTTFVINVFIWTDVILKLKQIGHILHP